MDGCTFGEAYRVGGASIPGASDIAIFDGANGSNGSCTLTADRNVGGIAITSNFSGNLDLESHDLTIGAAGVLIAGGGVTGGGGHIAVNGDVSIGGGAFTNLFGQSAITGDINITGGLLDFSTGEVLLTGSNDQEFISTLLNPINELTIDKPSGEVLLNSDILIANTLSLADGIVRTGSNVIRLGISDSSPGELNAGAGKIDGAFSRWVSKGSTGTLLFPLGNTTANAPFTLTVFGPPDLGGTYTIRYNDAETPAFGPVSFLDGPDVLETQSAASWSMQTSGLSGGSYSLSAANDHLGSVGELSALHFTLASSVVGTHEPATGTLSNPVLQRTGLVASDLADTWYASSEAVALPLLWGSLEAVPVDGTVRLGWSTLQEYQTSYFVIEHAVAGNPFLPTGTVNAAGNHSGVLDYTYTHGTPFPGINYYRLRQVDLDGTFAYSAVTTALVPDDVGRMITHLANPVTGDLEFISAADRVAFVVVDAGGRIMVRGTLNKGTHRIDSNSWSAGIYQLATSVEGRPREVYRVVKF